MGKYAPVVAVYVNQIEVAILPLRILDKMFVYSCRMG